MVDSTNLPEVDINAIATDLNNKMDRDGVNAIASVCIESWHSGTEWYRVYSDGWCEQGGVQSCVANTNTTVSLFKSFADTNYSVQITYNGGTGTGATGGASAAANLKTTSSFAIGSEGGPYSWFAYGYTR